jgi:hypothetical protein
MLQMYMKMTGNFESKLTKNWKQTSSQIKTFAKSNDNTQNLTRKNYFVWPANLLHYIIHIAIVSNYYCRFFVIHITFMPMTVNYGTIYNLPRNQSDKYSAQTRKQPIP